MYLQFNEVPCCEDVIILAGIFFPEVQMSFLEKAGTLP
jgi:hypothetical protein